MQCSHCHSEIEASSKFCTYCGMKQPSDTAVPSAQTVSATINPNLTGEAKIEDSQSSRFTKQDKLILLALAGGIILLLVLLIKFWFIIVPIGAVAVGIWVWWVCNPTATDKLQSIILGAVKIGGSLAVVGFILYAIPVTRYWTGALLKSKDIATSYLPNYSKSIKIGEAFYDYFANPSWDNYSEQGQDYVVFSGEELYTDGSKSEVEIVFLLMEDGAFRVDDIILDGMDLGLLNRLNFTIIEDAYAYSENS